MTIEALTLNNTGMARLLCEEYPSLSTKGFWKAMLAAFPDFALDPPEFKRVPDAYAVRAEEQEVDVFEVEITHPIPKETMRDWCALWFALDSLEIQMRMYVVNRYGHVNEVDMPLYWEHFAL